MRVASSDRAPGLQRGSGRTTLVGGTSGHRLHWLDTLRGVAALMVVFGHFFSPDVDVTAGGLFDPGVFGVAVFFLISGYIIPLSVRPERDRPALRFAFTRVFRLYPLYWVGLAFGIAVFGAGTEQSLINALMIQRYVGVEDVVGVFWTLQIELMFYVIVFGTILTGQFNRVPLVTGAALGFAVLAILLALIRYYAHVKTPLAAAIGLAVIFVGNLTSCWVAGRVSPGRFRLITGFVLACVVAACCFGYASDWGFGERPARFVSSYVLASATFFVFVRFDRIRFRLGEFIGVISYPVYLIHQEMFQMALNAFPNANHVLMACVTIVAVIGLSYGLHVAVEKPGVRLGREVLARWLAPVPA